MLIRGVIDHELGDHLQPAPMGLLDEMTKVIERPVIRVHVAVVGDVVAVVLERRGIERQQPDGVDAELLDVVEPLRQPGEIADAVVVRVEERLDMHLIDDGVLVPERIDVALRGSSCTGQRGIRAGTLDVQGQHAFGGTFVVVHIRDRICARLELQSHTIDTKTSVTEALVPQRTDNDGKDRDGVWHEITLGIRSPGCDRWLSSLSRPLLTTSLRLHRDLTHCTAGQSATR